MPQHRTRHSADFKAKVALVDHLTTPESPVGRDRIRRLMLVVGIESLAHKRAPAGGNRSIRSIPTY